MSDMNSPPPPYYASEGAHGNQAAPEYTTLRPEEHPRMHPPPPPYTPCINANVNTNTNLTSYELTLQIYSDGFWQGPINTFEGADAIHIPEAILKQLCVPAKKLRIEKFAFSITNFDRQTVCSGLLNNVSNGAIRISDDGQMKVSVGIVKRNSVW
ncbi:hypothetical protein OCU04_003796 [Sclerotinia nivalis]|uniref:Uncharacterized protein n=1 Tax=Sclerotinia nivalis TaxID=352851 RepID=A0A9X0ATK6_9HELO|nr:hypothetical protein OCU04_003796 [Sclerotinia nivalis]